MSLLSISGLTSGYGPVQVLFGLDLEVAEGEVLAFVGRNGMGKTTTIRVLTGELPAHQGSVLFDGRDQTRMAAHLIARQGIGLVPEGRQVFPNLNVDEHLQLAHARRAGDHWSPERVFKLFPRLHERRAQMAGTLSGGEQQMLALGRALVGNPRLLILDEATEGLAPLVRREMWTCLEEIARTGLSVLVVDKNIRALARIAQRFAVISKGQTIWTGTAANFAESEELHHRYLGV